jgi:hypothetical protein
MYLCSITVNIQTLRARCHGESSALLVKKGGATTLSWARVRTPNNKINIFPGLFL